MDDGDVRISERRLEVAVAKHSMETTISPHCCLPRSSLILQDTMVMVTAAEVGAKPCFIAPLPQLSCLPLACPSYGWGGGSRNEVESMQGSARAPRVCPCPHLLAGCPRLHKQAKQRTLAWPQWHHVWLCNGFFSAPLAAGEKYLRIQCYGFLGVLAAPTVTTGLVADLGETNPSSGSKLQSKDPQQIFTFLNQLLPPYLFRIVILKAAMAAEMTRTEAKILSWYITACVLAHWSSNLC